MLCWNRRSVPTQQLLSISVKRDQTRGFSSFLCLNCCQLSLGRKKDGNRNLKAFPLQNTFLHILVLWWDLSTLLWLFSIKFCYNSLPIHFYISSIIFQFIFSLVSSFRSIDYNFCSWRRWPARSIKTDSSSVYVSTVFGFGRFLFTSHLLSSNSLLEARCCGSTCSPYLRKFFAF